MNNSNDKKATQLGMSPGKANNILRKSIMFDLVCRLKLIKYTPVVQLDE